MTSDTTSGSKEHPDGALGGLLARVAEGDERALGMLFETERAALFTFLLRLSRCESTAEDLLQNTFLNLWRYRGAIRLPASPRAYLFKIALNEWRQCAGRDRRRRVVHQAWTRQPDGPEATRPPPPPDRALLQAERQHVVWEAIDQLPEAQREVFLLHRMEGLSCPQIAEALGEKLKTVESRLRLALLKLTETLLHREDHL